MEVRVECGGDGERVLEFVLRRARQIDGRNNLPFRGHDKSSRGTALESARTVPGISRIEEPFSRVYPCGSASFGAVVPVRVQPSASSTAIDCGRLMLCFSIL